MNREVRKKMKAANKEWIEEHGKNKEKEVKSGDSKEAYNTLERLSPRPISISHQSSKTAVETF